jgi:hypothetical protein
MCDSTTFVTKRLGLYSSVKATAVRAIASELLCIPGCYAPVSEAVKQEVTIMGASKTDT